MQLAANTKRGGDRYVENQPQDRLMKLEGVVEHMIYENTETGYAVFEVDAGGTDLKVKRLKIILSGQKNMESRMNFIHYMA